MQNAFGVYFIIDRAVKKVLFLICSVPTTGCAKIKKIVYLYSTLIISDTKCISNFVYFDMCVIF